MKVSVLGGGSFGTVLANIAASNGNNVDLWVRDSEQALRINSEGANSSYHPELKLSENIQASEILEDVVKDSSLILIATPSLIFENIVKRIVPFIKEGAHIVSCTKGIKSNPFRSMSEIISVNVNSSKNKVGVLSGPNLAKEIAEKKVTGTVIASLDNTLINDVKMVLASETFKVYSSNDVQGIELAGSLKNVYAIICGIADSLDVGENAVGLILTRSMAEMSRFAVARGANPITFLGLAGMGDLVATCSSNLSRNFQFGFNIGNGLSISESKDKVGQVAEGIRTLEVIREESEKLKIKMPLLDSLYSILYEEKPVGTIIDDLINNPHEVDVEFTY